MKKSFFIILFIPLLAINLFTGCKEQGSPFIVWRKITNQMINSYGGYMFLRADIDSVLYSGIHTAKIQAHIYGISDTISIVRFGHVFSIDNPLPTLKSASSVITSDSISFSPNDSVLNYISTLTNLSLDTSYYVRAFVITKTKGGKIDTAYNINVKRFHTARPEDIWFIKQDFSASDPRSEAVSFVINNKPYIGTGKNGLRLLNDFWEYDPNSDSWTNVANLPGTGRYKASAFVLNDTAYVGLGLTDLNDTTSFVGDFWKSYSMQFWEQIDSIDKTAERYDAVGFSALYNHELKGFVAFGHSYGVRSDIYMYDPKLDVDTTLRGAWVNLGDITPARYGAVAVSSPDKSFVILGGGRNFNGYLNDFYIYYPTTGSKIKFSEDFPGPDRYDAVAAFITFERDGTTKEMFYYGTGKNDTTYFNDWYAYDLTQEKWYKKSPIHEDFIIGSPRAGAVSFAVKKAQVQYGLNIRIFVLTGFNGDAYLNDVWEYLP